MKLPPLPTCNYGRDTFALAELLHLMRSARGFSEHRRRTSKCLIKNPLTADHDDEFLS